MSAQSNTPEVKTAVQIVFDVKYPVYTGDQIENMKDNNSKAKAIKTNSYAQTLEKVFSNPTQDKILSGEGINLLKKIEASLKTSTHFLFTGKALLPAWKNKKVLREDLVEYLHLIEKLAELNNRYNEKVAPIVDDNVEVSI